MTVAMTTTIGRKTAARGVDRQRSVVADLRRSGVAVLHLSGGGDLLRSAVKEAGLLVRGEILGRGAAMNAAHRPVIDGTPKIASVMMTALVAATTTVVPTMVGTIAATVGPIVTPAAIGIIVDEGTRMAIEMEIAKSAAVGTISVTKTAMMTMTMALAAAVVPRS